MLNQEEKWLLEEKYKGEKSSSFFADCERLAKGEPLGYVIGYVPFLNCQIYLDSKPLVPRVETEFWTEKAIESIKLYGSKHPASIRVLDLCAGSGAIGVAIAKKLTNVLVDFSELDEQHTSTIKKNIINNDIDLLKVNILTGNLFENVVDKYDFILSNPPYIDKRLNRTADSVKKYEPHLALFAENNGVELISRIINEAPTYLNKGGQLWIEHEPEQSESIKNTADKVGYSSIQHHKDQYAVTRYSVLVY